MEKLYEWVRQIAYVMVLISVIMQLAAGKQYQKYIRLYTGIVLILFMLVPVFRIFGTDTTGFMTEAEKKYTEMVEQIETKSAELEEEDVEKVWKIRRGANRSRADRSGEIRIGR